MKKFSSEHHFPGIEPDEFNELWNNLEVFQRITDSFGALKERTVIEQSEDENHMHRKVKYAVKGEIPKWAQSLLKPHMLSWDEETEYDKKTRVYKTKFIPHYFSEKIENDVMIRLLPDGKGGTRRISEGSLKIKITGLGRIAEKFMEGLITKTADKEYELMKKEVERYLKEKEK